MKSIFKTNLLVLATAIIVTITITGCSVKNELKQGVQKDLKVLSIGVPREKLIEEIGKPVDSILDHEGNKKDTYIFTQGYSDTITTVRITGHVIASLATWGLYELLAAEPEEGTVGDNVIILVHYDENDTVKKIKVIEGKDVLKEVPSDVFYSF